MMREIGSEFWQSEKTAEQTKDAFDACFLAGRTALAYMISDIRKCRTLDRVLLPIYCCESMIEPFESDGVTVSFYPVSSTGAALCDVPDCDAILLFDAFGYVSPATAELARAAHNRNQIVIYDATHKLNGNPAAEAFADYSFCSRRKWYYCNEATVHKYSGRFDAMPSMETNHVYLESREAAAEKKARYMAGETDDKDGFLRLYREAEELLQTDYRGYAGIHTAIDTTAIVAARRRNAVRLIAGLNELSGLTLWHTTVGYEDVPLFVPVSVSPGLRDAFRRHLMAERIYCPVHWPVPGEQNKACPLYDEEVSLICDQRYTDADIDREIKIIQSFFKENRKQ